MIELPVAYENLLSTGRSLGDHGICEIGLCRDDALKGVEVLRHAGIPVLGGDEWILGTDNDRVVGTWYSERTPRETDEEFAERSWHETESYIESAAEPSHGAQLFVLVIP